MQNTRLSKNPILVGLTPTPSSDWSGEINKLTGLGIDEMALFLRDLSIADRRAVYRALETVPLRAIPYVQLPADIEEWEARYLMVKYQTVAFSLPADDSTFTFMASAPVPVPPVFIENPGRPRQSPLFSQETLARPNVCGVCLDTAALEHCRLTDRKGYDAVISVLDHTAVGVAVISPSHEHWYARFAKPSKRLDTLKDLRYLRHFPPSYFSGIMALRFDNLFEEQTEIRAYLASIFRKEV